MTLQAKVLEGAPLPYPGVEVVCTRLLLVGYSGSRVLQTWRAQVVEKRGLFGGRRGTVQVLTSCIVETPSRVKREGGAAGKMSRSKLLSYTSQGKRN